MVTGPLASWTAAGEMASVDQGNLRAQPFVRFEPSHDFLFPLSDSEISFDQAEKLAGIQICALADFLAGVAALSLVAAVVDTTFSIIIAGQLCRDCILS
jgi:hypothetical protein